MTPVTTPDVELTVAVPLVVLHVPPTVASASGIVAPTHTTDGPVIEAGSGLTVTGKVVLQPVPNE